MMDGIIEKISNSDSVGASVIKSILKSSTLLEHSNVIEIIALSLKRYRTLESVGLRNIAFDKSLARNPAIQETVAHHIKGVYILSEYLWEFRGAWTLLNSEPVRKVVLGRIDDLCKELEMSKYEWIRVAGVKIVRYLITNEAIQQAIGRLIKKSDEPWKILKTIGKNPILETPHIREAIISQAELIRKVVARRPSTGKEIRMAVSYVEDLIWPQMKSDIGQMTLDGI
jgi:hypothetical protein